MIPGVRPSRSDGPRCVVAGEPENKVIEKNTFSDGAAYERFMARWSRAAGSVFLDWVAPAKGASWIDIGCGTGVFTELVMDTCSPAAVAAVDPSADQIELARSKPLAERVDFRVADAQALPFGDATFDVVASALVINFIPDRLRATGEMRRVVRPGGIVAAYVWDFMAGGSPITPIRDGLAAIGARNPAIHGAEDSPLETLGSLFAGAGLQNVATRTIEVTMSFPSFDDYWRTQLPPYSPTGKAVAALSAADREKLMQSVRAVMPAGPGGGVSFTARANAIKSRAPA